MADMTTTPHLTGDSSESQGGARDKAQEAAGQAQEKASELAGQAKEQAQQAAGQAKSQLRTQVDQRSSDAGRQVTQTASDIRTVSETLREQGKDGPAKLADQAADRAERIGSYLERSDADRIMGDVEDFARRQPWVVIAGGLAAGFMASRFLKASQSDRYQQRYSSRPSYQLPNTTQRPVGTTTPPMGTTGNELSGGVGAGVGDVGTPRRTGTPVGTVTETERGRFGRQEPL